ncbi:hypothetical protein D9R21_04765 [Spiroplasma endosymbiont of Megaselia nigra]|nr:hypothetical protein D9R21_04765 [Spiroplasma endosymbiont of Megaselia nigra]
MYNNTIGKKKQATFYRNISRNKKLYGNYKLQKMMKIFLTKYSSPNNRNIQGNNFFPRQSNKTYSQYIINNFNYLLKQNTRHKTNYKLSVAPNLRKISLEKLHSGIAIEQLRASKNDVYKNENIDNNKTYLNEYMFRDENNNWVIKKNNDLTQEDKINIINRDNQWYRQQIKEAHEKGLNKSITVKSIVKADNVITFTRTSLLKQGMTPTNVDIIQKEWITTVKNYLIKDLSDDLRGIYLHTDETNPHFHYHFLPRNREQTITNDMKNGQERVQIHPKGKIGSKGIITKQRLIKTNNDLRELFNQNPVLKNIDWSRLSKYELALTREGHFDNEDLHTYKRVERLKETLPYIRQREYEKTFKTMTNDELKVCIENIKEEANWKLSAINKIAKQREQNKEHELELTREITKTNK